MRVLVVSNMKPTSEAPQRGSFVRDQIAALRAIGLDVETFDWPAGSWHYVPAVRSLRRLLCASSFDVVHAHYGLAGACTALAGAKPLVVTFHGTDVRHPFTGAISRRLTRRPIIAAVASRALFRREGDRPGLPRPPGRSAVLPCGIDLERFGPMPRAQARQRLGLDPHGRHLLFPASPGREVKRHDRAAEIARRTDSRLLNFGSVPPCDVPLWINAASAVLITSDNEGFGMAAVEALACQTPVLSTPVGVIPHLVAGLDRCLVGPFEADAWTRVAEACLADPTPLEAGRTRAEPFGALPLAERVAAVYRDVVGIA